MSSENSGTGKVENFLDSNPDFLALYLRRRMRAAVSSYLENNPQFLSEYLDSLPDTYIGNTDSLPRNFSGNNCNSNHLLTKNNGRELLCASKSATRSSQSVSYESDLIQNTKYAYHQPKSLTLQPHSSQFSLHGQQYASERGDVGQIKNKNGYRILHIFFRGRP